MRPLLWALKAIDLCDICDLNSFVHHGVRVCPAGLALLGLFAALVCVRWPAKAKKLRGPRYAPPDVCGAPDPAGTALGSSS